MAAATRPFAADERNATAEVRRFCDARGEANRARVLRMTGSMRYLSGGAVRTLTTFGRSLRNRAMPIGRRCARCRRDLKSAHVVRLAHASHDVYRSNEADALREMNAFISTLPP
jgi:hypothetical protein